MRNEIEIRWALLESEAEERTGGHSEQVARETAGNGTAVPKVSGQEQNGRQPALARSRQGRRLSALGRELLADILLESYDIDLSREEEPIARHPLGKPYLTGHEGLYFSISHSGSWAACAVGRTPLGLDIQYRKKKETDALAARILDAGEFSSYENSADRNVSFYDFWVKKESYLKYTGEGIRKDLRIVTYENCRFFFFPEMIAGCAAALCVPAGWNGTIKITGKASGNR